MAIALLNLKSLQFIETASVSGQCAKDYFYGKDGQLEDWFGDIEGAYGTIVKKLEANMANIEQEELSFLRDYTLLQYLRTEQSLKHDRLAQTKMLDMIFHGNDEGRPQDDMSYPSLAASSVAMFQDAVKYIDDLSVCIVENQSDIEFVTSDDPAIRANRFQQKRPKFDGFDTGIMGAGELIILPLAPRIMMIAYDKNVYRIEGRRGVFLTLDNCVDARSLNEFQYLNALNNIYFSDWDQKKEVLAEAKRLNPHRRSERFCINYAVFDHSADGVETFRAVKDMSEASGAARAMIASHTWALRPTQWPSFLKYRLKPKYLVVGVGKDWVRRDDKNFDETPYYF